MKRTGVDTLKARRTAGSRKPAPANPATAAEAVRGAATRFRSPLYHQIYLNLRQAIVDGDLRPGDLVPGEQDLSDRHGVSRITAKRALDELAAAGLVVRERGRGTRVVAAPSVRPISTDVDAGIDPLIAMGGVTEARVVEFDLAPAEAEVAQLLGIAEGAPVQRAVRVRSAEGLPFSHLTTQVPGWAVDFDRADLAATPLLTLFERVGLRASSAEQTVSATLADDPVADRLQMDLGAPLLRVERLVKDQNGRAIEHLVALYRTDRYRMSMSLARGAAEGWDAETVAGAPAAAGGEWQAVAGRRA